MRLQEAEIGIGSFNCLYHHNHHPAAASAQESDYAAAIAQYQVAQAIERHRYHQQHYPLPPLVHAPSLSHLVQSQPLYISMPTLVGAVAPAPPNISPSQTTDSTSTSHPPHKGGLFSSLLGGSRRSQKARAHEAPEEQNGDPRVNGKGITLARNTIVQSVPPSKSFSPTAEPEWITAGQATAPDSDQYTPFKLNGREADEAKRTERRPPSAMRSASRNGDAIENPMQNGSKTPTGRRTMETARAPSRNSLLRVESYNSEIFPQQQFTTINGGWSNSMYNGPKRPPSRQQSECGSIAGEIPRVRIDVPRGSRAERELYQEQQRERENTLVMLQQQRSSRPSSRAESLIGVRSLSMPERHSIEIVDGRGDMEQVIFPQTVYRPTVYASDLRLNTAQSFHAVQQQMAASHQHGSPTESKQKVSPKTKESGHSPQQQQQNGAKPESDSQKDVQASSNSSEPELALQHNGEILQLGSIKCLGVVQVMLGLSLFGLGLCRLLLLAKWGLGIEVVFGVYVAITGMLGFIGVSRRHMCCIIAFYSMSALSALLAIFPFVNGLLFTIPHTFSAAKEEHFVSKQTPYGIDLALSAACLLQIIIAVSSASLGCYTAGKVLEFHAGVKLYSTNIEAAPCTKDEKQEKITFEETPKTETETN